MSHNEALQDTTSCGMGILIALGRKIMRGRMKSLVTKNFHFGIGKKKIFPFSKILKILYKCHSLKITFLTIVCSYIHKNKNVKHQYYFHFYFLLSTPCIIKWIVNGSFHVKSTNAQWSKTPKKSAKIKFSIVSFGKNVFIVLNANKCRIKWL